MSNIYGAPNGIERRAYRTTNATLSSIPAVNPQQVTSGKLSDPLKRTCTREYLVQLLEGQIELALDNKYPMSVVLAEFTTADGTIQESEAVLYAVAQHFNLNLRPTDIVMRFRNKTLAMILHECDEIGARLASQRLTAMIADGVRVGGEKVLLKPHYGFSSQLTRESDRSSKLLSTAEVSLRALQEA
jgi:GGDEF domain-containing protein